MSTKLALVCNECFHKHLSSALYQPQRRHTYFIRLSQYVCPDTKVYALTNLPVNNNFRFYPFAKSATYLFTTPCQAELVETYPKVCTSKTLWLALVCNECSRKHLSSASCQPQRRHTYFIRLSQYVCPDTKIYALPNLPVNHNFRFYPFAKKCNRFIYHTLSG